MPNTVFKFYEMDPCGSKQASKPQTISRTNLQQMSVKMKVEIMSDAALKLQYSKLTVNRSDVYDKILLLLQPKEVVINENDFFVTSLTPLFNEQFL